MISKVGAGTTAYLQPTGAKKSSQEVRETKEMGKVESIKEQVQSGDYKVDMTKTAEAVAKDLI